MKTPIDEALEAISHLEKVGSLRKIATKLNKSPSSLIQLVGLLKLDPRVQELIKQRLITKTHGRELTNLPPEEQYRMAQRIINERLTIHTVRQLLKGPPKTQSKEDVNIKGLEKQLSEHFATEVRLVTNKTPASIKGYIKINYHSLDELDGILQKIGPMNYPE